MKIRKGKKRKPKPSAADLARFRTARTKSGTTRRQRERAEERRKIVADYPLTKSEAYARHVGAAYAELLGQEYIDGKTYAQVMAYTILERAIAGNVRAAKEIREAVTEAIDGTDWRAKLAALGLTDPEALINELSDKLYDAISPEGSTTCK
jgi:hypothetical protein